MRLLRLARDRGGRVRVLDCIRAAISTTPIVTADAAALGGDSRAHYDALVDLLYRYEELDLDVDSRATLRELVARMDCR